MLQKFAGPVVRRLFVGAPVRPNMLNTPKSVSAGDGLLENTIVGDILCVRNIVIIRDSLD